MILKEKMVIKQNASLVLLSKFYLPAQLIFIYFRISTTHNFSKLFFILYILY